MIDRRRRKQLRNMVCAAWCALQLGIVLLGFYALGQVMHMMTDVSDEQQPVIAEAIILEEKPKADELIICIDAGHGGKDNGADYKGRYEKDDNLKLAKSVAAYLEKKGIKIVMTREDDTFLSLEERCEFAKQNGADYLISLHRNTGDGNGVETWIYSAATYETTFLAQNIQDKLEQAGIQRNRGVKKGTQNGESGNYYVNIHSDMPSCIVEMGFMGNATDNRLFDEKLDAYAAAIGDAVLETYDRYGDANKAGQSESGDAAASETGINVGATGQEMQETTADTAQREESVTQQIDLQGLATGITNWGLGKHTDEKNRPQDALTAQEKYGAYNAMFIGADSQTIYLTFDEGYEYGYTESILNTLKEKEVKAVFFVTEPYAKAEPELVKRMIDEGHVLGNHSVTHPSTGIPSLSIEEQQNEVLGNHQYVKENFGYEMNLFRYPAGKFSEQSLAIVNNCGYKSVFWSFAYMDYDVNNQPNETESLNKMVDKLHPGAVYLLHAESKTNAAVLGRFIDAAKEKGYTFEGL